MFVLRYINGNVKTEEFHDDASPNFVSLSKTGKLSLTVKNAGGNSRVSEAYSISLFEKMYKAKNFLLETQVEYWIDYKMCDFLCSIDGRRVGVSVTRAMFYEDPLLFTISHSDALLNKKLEGLIISRNCVADKHTFFEAYLHIWCQTRDIARLCKESFDKMVARDDSYSEVILLLTVSDCKEIYFNKKKK
jgi:hypothetical protein